ncbi:MAG: ThiF family adenylyltransferase [Candidatus Eremiobacteraeota bacterium]|nr:ThiF family adenylyltransferase [Candidatus Eremiobacteraeota bacterium]MCW5866911.1 ThiF family adenylyltransferase [Candidatus Eremiobacteraeota bacterium]
MKMLICGVGTLGGNLVEHLARTGLDALTVLDHDKVQPRNLANQPYFQHQLAKSKVAALAETVFRIRGQQIETVHKRLHEGNARGLVKGYELVVDCFDNHQARHDLQQACRQARVDLVHMGLSLDYGEVIWDEHYRVPPDVARDPCAEPLARRLALQAVLLFEKARAGRENLCFTAGDLVVTRI